MKIFNWMHRKWHPGVVKYSQVSHKKDVPGGDHEELEKKEMSLEGVTEKEALLLHDVLNGAILAIGTLGRDDCFLPQFYSTEEDDGHLVMPAAEKEENNALEEVEEEEELQVKEIVAPAFTAAIEPAAAATFVVVQSVRFKAPPIGPEELLEKKLPKMATQADSAEEAERIQELPLLKEDREKRERGRTTLADLFAADHSFMAIDTSAEMTASKEGVNDRVKLRQHAAANYSEKKKTEKNKKEEKWTSDTVKASNTSSSGGSSNRKLQKLVTKMLKKKIHPEIPGAQKTATACNCKERD